MKQNNNSVDIKSTSYRIMEESWELPHDLLGGTRSMRAAGEKWLPKEDGEKHKKYKVRLERSTLYNGYSDTIEKLSNRPFSHPLNIVDLPVKLDYLRTDVDGRKKSFSELAKGCLRDLTIYGLTHVIVDFTTVKPREDGVITAKDELGSRVYFKSVSPVNLIGWQFDEDPMTGAIDLAQIRIKEVTTESDGDFGDKVVERIKVITKDDYTIWTREEAKIGSEKSWVKGEAVEHSFGRIPLITMYANKVDELSAKPPLEDLAWINVTHWQSSSDQRNILRFSRFGILFGKGFTKKDIKNDDIVVSPTEMILTSAPDAELKYVEHTGKSIAAGQADLDNLEMQMKVLGMQPLMSGNNKDTATGKRIDEGRTVSQLQSWVESIEVGLAECIKVAAEWEGVEILNTMSVDIYSDFDVDASGKSDIKILAQMEKDNQITQETLLNETKRRGVLSDGVNVEWEIEQTALAVKDSMTMFEDEKLDEDEGIEEDEDE